MSRGRIFENDDDDYRCLASYTHELSLGALGGASCVSLKRRGAAGGGVNARGVAVILNDPIFATNTLLVMLL